MMVEAPERPVSQRPDDSEPSEAVPPDQIGPDDHDDNDDDGDQGPWVTIATFWRPGEAQIARLKLEGEDIDCILLDELTVTTLIPNMVGGIKLQVPAAQAARAAQSLARTPESVNEPSNDEPRYDGQELCPRCGSEYIHRSWFNRKWTAISALLGMPLPFITGPRWRCRNCQFEWRSSSSGLD